MKKLFSWLIRLKNWIFEPSIAWIGLSILAAAIYLPFYIIGSEISIRVSGLLLEALSILIILVGITKTRKLFGHKPLWSVTLSWVSRFPRWKGKVAFGVAHGNLGAFSGRAHITAWAQVKPEDTLQQQIDALVKNTIFLRDDLQAARKEYGEQIKEFREAMTREQDERSQSIKQLNDLLTNALADGKGVYWSLVGIVWLSVGIAMSTMSVELTCLFGLSYSLCR